MTKGVFIQTDDNVHHAHILAIPRDGQSPELLRSVDELVKAVLSYFPGVEENRDFRGTYLTEMAIQGTDLESVTRASNELAGWVERDPELLLMESREAADAHTYTPISA